MNDEIFMVMFFTMYLALIIVYVFIFYFILLKRIKKKKMFRGFHNAAISIKARNMPMKESLEQLTLNYNKLSQEHNNTKLSLLDISEQIIYFYDTYTDKFFQSKLRINKDLEIRDFLFSIVEFIKQTEPFNKSPTKRSQFIKHNKRRYYKE